MGFFTWLSGLRTARGARSKRQGLPDFLRRPPKVRISVADASEEGLMLAEYAAIMELKNRIIEGAIRGDAPYDPADYAEDARQVLLSLSAQSQASAARAREEQEAALLVRGKPHHQHDYHAGDVDNLEARAEVNDEVADRLLTQRDDEARVLALVERARVSAWNEIAAEVEATLERTWPEEPELDDAYASEREERMWMVRFFDLIELSMQSQAGRGPEPEPALVDDDATEERPPR